MVPAPENVYSFEWDSDRKVYVPTATRRPTFYVDVTTSSNVHNRYENDYKSTAIIVFVVIMFICIVIFILWKSCLCSCYRPFIPVTTTNTSQITNSYHTQTEGYSDTTIFSLIELHAFSPNMSQDINNGFTRGNMAHDQPPNYFDVTLIKSSRNNTKLTERPETPPPNYYENKQKMETDVDKC